MDTPSRIGSASQPNQSTPATSAASGRAEFAHRLPLLLRTLVQAQQRVRNAAAGEGITGTQLSVLTAVVHRPGIDHRSVCDLTFIDDSTVASVVATLARRELLEQSRSAVDGRRRQLRATAEAWALVYGAQRRLQAGNETLLRTLPARRRSAFIESLQRLAYADRRDPPDRYVIPSPHGRGPELRIPWGLGRLVRGCLQRYTRIWSELARPSLTSVQYLALSALKNAGAIDQRTLGDKILVDKATLTVLLQRLERAGLITRVPDAQDGRRRLLKLDPSARGLLRQVGRVEELIATRFLSPLPARRQAAFLATLTEVAAHARRSRLSVAANANARPVRDSRAGG